MATRALIGFLDDDKQLVGTYNHYDGYPEHLGKVLVKHFNDEEAAERLASTGYISSIDIDTGDIDSKYDEEPSYKVLDAESAFEAGLMIGDMVDSFGGDYGYVWVKPLQKWITVKNSGTANIAKQIEDELGESGMYMVDEIEENIMEEGYEAKWAKFLNEAKDVNFDIIKSYIKNKANNGQYQDGSFDYAIDAYIDSLKNSFRLGAKEDYVDYEMDDYVEDFDNYLFDRMDS
jgi:hypothetical protein